MKLHELHAIPGANKAVTRKGRGIGSGNGKTAGFGSKGQKARSGVKHAGFEGGQMPLARRLPKVGFNNIFATQYAIVNVADLEAAFEAGEVVDTEALKAKGLVKKTLDIMAFIEFKNIGKKYAGAEKKSVDDFNLEINEKEFIAFVGPSGCGKSTTLRMIAGFEEITEGELYIDGKKVNEVAPRDRGIAMVFQNYALYPHMTVEKNIGYGLKNMKMPADQIKKKVDWAIDILGLQEYRNRKPKNLSGGQRQRVALGRAIVKNQKVFLMDEPLSNLDAKLRVSMRTEISKLHRELGATTIYVTHDQVEAMTMADRIVIMKDGVIQQVGKPMELYDHPVNKFVAGFIGSPQMNFFDVVVTGNKITFADGNTFTLAESVVKKLNGKEGEMILGIRGEDLKMDAANLDLYKESRQKAVITNTEVMGNENNLYFQFGGCQAVARVSKYEISQVDDEIEFVFVPSKMHFFDKETEMNYM